MGDNNKTDFKDVGIEGLDLIQLARTESSLWILRKS